MDNRVQLGNTVKDKITGFAGTVTGRAEYITGCTQVLVQPPVKDDGTFADGHWFDETRVEVTGSINTDGLQRDSGPDVAAPIK